MAERIHGPYEHRTRWRVVGVRADGTRFRESYATYEEAKAIVDQARIALGTRTVGLAVAEYLEDMKAKGRREGTIATAGYRLHAFLRVRERDRMLVDLGPSVAKGLYAQRVTEVRPDTHRGELALASTWAAWCVARGYLASNPFEGVEPQGEKSTGKDQLRLDEARAFLRAALAEDSKAGTACALTLLTGARASEITDRVVRDLDDGGRLLWIPVAKTRAGVRHLAVPEVVRARVWALAAGRKPTERLWGDVSRHWLGHHVRRLCEAAGVPVVSPHGLRGLHATIALRAGSTADVVARALGHVNAGVTRRHYFEPGAEAETNAERLAEVITEQPQA